MNKMNNEQEEYLLLKIKSPNGVDFYSKHKSVINRCGYIIFAKVVNSILKTKTLNSGDIIFIKSRLKTKMIPRAILSKVFHQDFLDAHRYTTRGGTAPCQKRPADSCCLPCHPITIGT